MPTIGLSSISVPIEVVSDPTVWVYSIVDTPTVPSNFKFVEQAFNLDAYQEGAFVEGFVFKDHITITLHYNEDEIDNNDERWLIFNTWNPDHNQWVDAATTCEPASV